MATSEPKPVTPLPFIDALLGYQKTAALKAAIELGVFDAIGAHGADIEAVCAKTNTSAHGARILCDYLTVLGFLEKSGTPITATFIDSRSPSSMASVVRFLAAPELLDMFLTDPAGFIRRGGTEGPGHTAPDDPIWVTFARSMTPFTVAAAKATATYVASWPKAPRRVLDIAAGAGMFGICVAQPIPEAGLDWRDVIELAAENAKLAGVDARYRTIAGDAFSADLGNGYDLILLPNILHHFSHATCVKLLQRVRAGLAPNGRAVAERQCAQCASAFRADATPKLELTARAACLTLRRRSTIAQCTLAEHVTGIFASRFRPLVILDQLACRVLQEIALR